MKKINYINISLILFLLFNILAFGSNKNVKVKKVNVQHAQAPLSIKYNTYFFKEDWEQGFGPNSWVSKDEADIGTKWHLTSWDAYGGSGQCWHMADTSLGTNGGYDNGWYQVLDTDPITLNGSGQKLTFYHRYSVEPPTNPEVGYDGWDGMNVRISTDNGATWNVLTNPSPAYSDTSLYSFGSEHHEGTGIPGWADSLESWTKVTFDLSAYSGKTVLIRFAFASDAEYSTPDNPSLFGWEIDNIEVTNSSSTVLFSNDGTLNGLTPRNNAAIGPNLWRIANIDSVDSSNYASCNTDSNTYLPNMKNSLTSNYFSLPRFATDIYFDFELRGSFSDLNSFPNVDYFGVYIQVEGESLRRFISNINNDSAGTNYVYSDAPSDWTLFSNAYNIGLVSLDSLKGKRIRIIFEFDSDSDKAIGSGLQIDNVVVYSPLPVSVKDDNSNNLSSTFKLEQNYPNPFNPSTVISYQLPVKGDVSLKIYDILGNEIATLVNEFKTAGKHQVKFDAGKYGLSSGIYFFQLKAGNFVQTKKLVLQK